MSQPHTLDEQNGNTDGLGLKIILGLIPLLVLLALFVLAVGMKVFTPKSERRKPPAPPAMTVEVLPIRPTTYQVVVESYGTVKPRTQSMMLAQVSGQVTSISPRLREGGFFEAGDTLLTIDERDYQANVEIAKATLIDARQNLAEEQARSNQASADWSRLGNDGTAPDLVLRKPQLSAAQARVASAQSQLDKASLNLERTKIKAPYAGRVMAKGVDVGQVVNPNTMLAEVYATDYVEVRLPLRDKDLAFVDLPEQYRADQGAAEDPNSVPVKVFSSLVNSDAWDGRIVRTESAIDSVARQLHCVAQIDDPFGAAAAGRTPLKIGEYVTAQITGRSIKNAIIVPTSAIYQSTFAYVVEDEQLQQRSVSIVWQNDREAIIGRGLEAGDQLVTTPLGQVTSGTPVRTKKQNGEVSTTTASSERTPGRRPKPGKPGRTL
ncbi:MAG: efflux RND transporter periplasmic adaptor subunit [Gammaproteobacteria bacterium]